MTAALLALSLFVGAPQGGLVIELPRCTFATIRPTFAPTVMRANQQGITRPRVISQRRPLYSAEAMRERVQGMVCLAAVVRADGRVGDVTLLHSLHPDLDDAAMNSAREWRFTAATYAGNPTPVVMTLEFHFRFVRGPD